MIKQRVFIEIDCGKTIKRLDFICEDDLFNTYISNIKKLLKDIQLIEFTVFEYKKGNNNMNYLGNKYIDVDIDNINHIYFQKNDYSFIKYNHFDLKVLQRQFKLQKIMNKIW